MQLAKQSIRLQALLAALCLFFTTDAQVVNIEQKRIVTDTVGWAGSANINFQLNKESENTEYLLVANSHLQFKTNKSLFLLLGNMATLQAADTRFINSGFAHFRYNNKLGSVLRMEAFSQIQFNKVQKVDQRLLFGAGPRLKIFSSDLINLYQGTLYMYEYEQVILPDEVNRDHRLSTYLSTSIRPNDNISISSTWYYQPKLSQFGDYRTSGQVKINMGITDKLKFTTAFNYGHDSRPPLDVPETTYRMSNGLTYKF